MSSSLSRNDSSAEEGENEFTPTQAIFPKTNDGGGSSNSLNYGGQQLLKRMNALETQQRQNEAETKEMFDQQIKQLHNEQKAFFDRIGEWEKNQEEKTNALADQLGSILDRMEEKQQQKYEESEKSFNDQFSQLHNEQKTLLGKISDLEKQQQMLEKQMKTDSDVKSNFWDANTCHYDLAISGPNRTMVHRKRNGKDWPTVFAKYSILRSAVVGPSNIFYFELNVKNLSRFVFFGFAAKHKTQLNEIIRRRTDTYAYENDGDIWINGSRNSGNERFDDGDTVGCGVNLANKQLFFTKNGHRIDATNDFLFSSSPSVHFLFPFVTLGYSNAKIDANFGPEFIFDLSTLC